MAFVAASRVLESFTTTGTGTITLAGAVTGYRAFSAVMSNADTCFYFMEGGADWEIGLGTYSAGTLARTTVLKSSNSNNAVNWAAGTKTVGIDALGPGDKTYAMRTQVFAAAGTYTPSPGMFACIVEAVGGGGGGGGAAARTGTGRSCAGSGGGGGYARKMLTAADIGASKAVAIGALGAGGTAGNNAGSAGGNTTLGTTLVVANGGSGGGGAAADSNNTGGAGGSGGTGDVLIPGGQGGPGISNSSAVTGVATQGIPGGDSALGRGGVSTINATGGAGGNYGGGGGGAIDTAGTNRAGGAGAAGYMIITEFIA